MRTAKDILQQKGPQFNYVSPEATVLEAINVMKTENISYLIVKDNDRYLGIISERDYTHKVILENKESKTTKVREIMTGNTVIAAPEDSTSRCMMLMNNSKSRYLPVFDGHNFLGVLTIHDLMREAITDYEMGNNSLNSEAKEFVQTWTTK